MTGGVGGWRVVPSFLCNYLGPESSCIRLLRLNHEAMPVETSLFTITLLALLGIFMALLGFSKTLLGFPIALLGFSIDLGC